MARASVSVSPPPRPPESRYYRPDLAEYDRVPFSKGRDAINERTANRGRFDAATPTGVAGWPNLYYIYRVDLNIGSDKFERGTRLSI